MNGIFPEGYNAKQIGTPFHTLKGSHNGDPNLPQDPDFDARRLRGGVPWHRQEDRTGPHDSGLAGATDRIRVSVPVEVFDTIEQNLLAAGKTYMMRGTLAMKLGYGRSFTPDEMLQLGKDLTATAVLLRKGRDNS